MTYTELCKDLAETPVNELYVSPDAYKELISDYEEGLLNDRWQGISCKKENWKSAFNLNETSILCQIPVKEITGAFKFKVVKIKKAYDKEV